MVRVAASFLSALAGLAVAPWIPQALAADAVDGLNAPPPPPPPPPSGRDCTGVKAIHPACGQIEPPYRRDFFYVGGSLLPGAFGNVTVGQLYVEKLTPAQGVRQPKPLVFFHGGGGFTGGTWLNTPDNRRGFAAWFLQQGYQVYLVDQPGLGRSSSNDLANFPLMAGSGPELVEAGFTAVEDYLSYPQAALHTQWPGTGHKGDPAFDQFAAAIIPSSTNRTATELAMRTAGCQLLSLIGPSYLIQHSYGGHWGILLSNDCGQNVAGSINLESSTIPFWWYGVGLGGTSQRPWGLTETKIDYVPAISSPSELQVISVGNETLAHRNCYLQKEPARKLPKIAKVPYLLLTTEASVHITFAHCLNDYMKQVGAKPDWVKLADVGIKGNGHFMYLEKNSDLIAGVVHKWIQGRR
ncbi:Alpha/Beta hydrolase protein [Microdochium trichocladiopsis]|uniref:Alpha/Beta hydrolase protein n=1 Tax=Microdochium trichocladiopsis TaxID=1682393 RepID=A0A9P8YIH7_9PEZI|nr:Alpha/Beta hydrolase protein [Microdochium trichocladiopsis]KAH7039624.1 Alpha/Beta hydrolase protein [Microdochium trichocladiopsis]